MSLDSFTQLPYTYACRCSSLRALENTQLLRFTALKDYYKQNGHTGDEGQKVPRQQAQQYEDLRALLFQQGVKHSPASSPCLTLHPVPAVPAAPPQRWAALWQKGKNPEHPHTHSASYTSLCHSQGESRFRTKRVTFCLAAGLGTCPSLAPQTPAGPACQGLSFHSQLSTLVSLPFITTMCAQLQPPGKVLVCIFLFRARACRLH